MSNDNINMPTTKRNIIWSNHILNFEEDWEEDLRAAYPNKSDGELHILMFEENDGYLGDEQLNLSGLRTPNGIIAIVDVGRWDGRFPGYRMFNTVSSCLERGECDEYEWYVDVAGEFKCAGYHHDGTNYVTYRGVKDGVTEEQLEELQTRLVRRGDVSDLIDALTYRLGDLISDVYGWGPFPNRSFEAQRRGGEV